MGAETFNDQKNEKPKSGGPEFITVDKIKQALTALERISVDDLVAQALRTNPIIGRTQLMQALASENKLPVSDTIVHGAEGMTQEQLELFKSTIQKVSERDRAKYVRAADAYREMLEERIKPSLLKVLIDGYTYFGQPLTLTSSVVKLFSGKLDSLKHAARANDFYFSDKDVSNPEQIEKTLEKFIEIFGSE